MSGRMKDDGEVTCDEHGNDEWVLLPTKHIKEWQAELRVSALDGATHSDMDGLDPELWLDMTTTIRCDTCGIRLDERNDKVEKGIYWAVKGEDKSGYVYDLVVVAADSSQAELSVHEVMTLDGLRPEKITATRIERPEPPDVS